MRICYGVWLCVIVVVFDLDVDVLSILLMKLNSQMLVALANCLFVEGADEQMLDLFLLSLQL